jgi:hypothetical protein
MSIEIIAPLRPEVLAQVAAVVESTIEQEYRLPDADAVLKGARMTAIAAIEMDLRVAWTERYNGEGGLRGYADTVLRGLVAEGLKARECQCAVTSATAPGHNHRETCHGHYEADVPPISGRLLCGPCHGDLYRTT